SIEHARSGKRIGRASIKTGGARPAVKSGVRRVRRQIQIEQERAEKVIAAAVLVDQHRVLADPAEPGPPREIALPEGSRIDHRPAPTIRPLRLHPSEKLSQLGAEDAVIIGPRAYRAILAARSDR